MNIIIFCSVLVSFLLTEIADSQFVVPAILFKKKVNSTRSRRQASEGCTLPRHPDHGQWEVLGGQGSPGGKIATDSVLKFNCHAGYKLSTQSQHVICDSEWDMNNMPQCLKLCPPLYSTTTTTLKCVNKNGDPINCWEATDGSYLSYQCIPYYEAPLGYRKNLICVEGMWNYQAPVCQPVCGKQVNDDVIQLVAGGTKLKKIKYPWITAVYKKISGVYTNVCGGSVISRKVILTAAHCVTNEYGDVYPENEYIISVAKLYNKYGDSRDTQAQYYELSNIVSHSGYKGESRRFLADIALLVTKKLIVLGPLVQPVCIDDLNNIYLHAGNTGEIAGWGNTEDGLPSDELRFIEIPYKSETVCSQELPIQWADKYQLTDKLCAGFYRKNVSVCNGDSGSALVFKNPEDNRYYVHGIVSLAPAAKEPHACNVQQNALYTKVAFYYEFVNREVTRYHAEDCQLPPYPLNGKYVVENYPDKVPGDIVFSNEILTVECSEGYWLSSTSSTIDCESSVNMAKCLMACPELTFPDRTIVSCRNDKGLTTDCTHPTEATILTFNCPEGYSVHPDSPTTRRCTKGSWGVPGPGCVQIPTFTTAASTVTTETSSYDDKIKVICTYASWSSYNGINPEDLNPHMCTHVYYAFAGLWDSGDMRVQNNALDINGAGGGLYTRVTDMKKKNSKLKVLLSIGGSEATNSSLFSSTAASPAKTGAFIGSTTYFINKYNFDGLNIEWYDVDRRDKENYVKFLRKLKESYKEKGWLLTATVTSTIDDAAFDVQQMDEILDFVIIKTFDLYGHWSKYTGEHTALYSSSKEYVWEKNNLNVDAAAKNWLHSGLTKKKLVISVAFYGRTFKLKDKNQHDIHAPIVGAGPGDGILSYSEICQKYENWSTVWNDEQKSVYKYNEDNWFSYDTKDAMWIKGAYVKDQGLLGVNVWSVDGDDVHGKCGMKQVLLKHLHGGLGHNVNWSDD